MNYYPFHIGDYASATRHLSWDEDAAFRRLLDVYYTTEKPIPLDERQVFRLVVAQTEAQREAVRTVLAEFFERTEDGWRNKRAEAEIEAMRDKQNKQREKANARWHKQRAEHGNAPAMPRHAPNDAAAQDFDADAMPPTPTPTPKEERARKRATPPSCPQGVDEQVWSDWLALRRAKHAPVTQTVIDSATAEAAKAGMPLGEFLKVWCARGSQGLQADWLKPHERLKPANDKPGPDDAERTKAMLESQRMTPEQKAAAEEARRRVMAGIRRIA